MPLNTSAFRQRHGITTMRNVSVIARMIGLWIGLWIGICPPLFAQSIPKMHWPIGYALHDKLFILMHVDTDRAEGSIKDYRCQDQYTYDGHRGTDISTYNFRLMDEGIPVLAAAEGVVTFVRFDQFDRNYWPPYRGDPNGVVIRHPDGSNTQYWHMRRNAVVVNVGETVAAGQFIGYIGSSGATPIPHLHFEIWENSVGQLDFRDPFEGPCTNQATLWTTLPSYPGDTALRILDMDVFNKTSLQGVESNNYFGETALKDRPFRPEVFGTHEAQLGLWVLLQGSPGASYTVRLFKPDGVVFATQEKTVTTKKGAQWHVFYWDFAAQVTAADGGIWTAQLEQDGQVVREVLFTVGETTTFAPRFFPLAGRSLRLGGVEQKDVLRLSGLEGDVTFHLVDAPGFVRLDAGQVIISASADPSFRNTFFHVVAVDEAGRADTMSYHLVDATKPINAVTTSVDSPPRTIKPVLEQNYPNPFSAKTRLSYAVDEQARVTLTVYNVLGQRIATLVDRRQPPGTYTVDFTGEALSPGVYLYRLAVGERVVAREMILTR